MACDVEEPMALVERIESRQLGGTQEGFRARQPKSASAVLRRMPARRRRRLHEQVQHEDEINLAWVSIAVGEYQVIFSTQGLYGAKDNRIVSCLGIDKIDQRAREHSEYSAR
jgi:hypothetical protein